MKALVYRGVENVRYETVPDAQIRRPTDGIVRVLYAGICGSDLHVYHGRERGVDTGTVMGHEMVGEVVEVGSAVQKWQPGDRVGCPFTTNCGDCFFCRMGLTARCEKGRLFGWVEKGSGLHGMQAEFVRVPLADSTLFALPEDVDERSAVLLGDVLPTGYFAAKNAGVRPGVVCVVLGCGPVGLMAVLAARHLGAARIFALDRVPARLQMAAEFGAEPVNFEEAEQIQQIQQATGGRGADAILEAVGSAGATRLAYRLVRAGGVISTVGVHTEGRFAISPQEAYDKNLTLKIGRCPARALVEEVLPLLRAEKDRIEKIFTHILPLSQGVHGYHLFSHRSAGCLKVLLQP